MLRCPRCFGPMPVSTKSLRRGNKCAQCGSELRMSEIYARVLGVVSMVLGVSLLWAIHVRDLTLSFWAVPMWFVVLSVLVRIAPHVIPPRLELHDSGRFATLDLQDGPKETGRVEP
jgi:uncharacterized protein (DUF983 family)